MASWKWFRFLRVATMDTLPSLNEGSAAFAQDVKRLYLHDGTQWKGVAYREDALPVGEIKEFAYKKITSPTENLPYLAIWDSDHDVDVAHWPLLVPELRAQTLEVFGSSALVTSWSGTVAGSVFTGPAAGTNAGDAWTNLLNALAEEELVQGTYSNWRCVNIAGVDYAISNVNSGSRTITVTGTPASGTQTLIVYPFRISGSTTTARVFKDAGRATMTPDGTVFIAHFRRRDHGQGHLHGTPSQYPTTTGITIYAGHASGATSADILTGAPVTDGTNGTPRVGPITEPNSSVVYRYIYGGQYIA
jgi:hypothetical protein